MNLAQYTAKHGRGSLRALAKASGIHETYLSQIKNGYKAMTLWRAKKLKRVAPELDLLALLEESEKRTER